MVSIMPRLDWVRENLWPRAVAAVKSRLSSGRSPEGSVELAIVAGDPAGAWQAVITYDPTPGHEALTWLLRRWTAGAIRGEDLAKAHDLGGYKTLAQLDRVLLDAGVDFDALAEGGVVNGKAQKREAAVASDGVAWVYVPDAVRDHPQVRETYDAYLAHKRRAYLADALSDLVAIFERDRA